MASGNDKLCEKVVEATQMRNDRLLRSRAQARARRRLQPSVRSDECLPPFICFGVIIFCRIFEVLGDLSIRGIVCTRTRCRQKVQKFKGRDADFVEEAMS